MSSNEQNFLIRGLTKSELSLLRTYATKNNFESLNAFLLFLVRDELEKQTILKYGGRTVTFIENTARVLNNEIDTLNSFTADQARLISKVDLLLEILNE
ncbi:hypothetical protein [Levilactobacillus brevis]|uniref:hypothetical protein n=1 Tax=Levilactobacillus brevis TaxID=1580 RepID=UPI000B363DB8|nr:hypothetical protein [Levilactobacillus brevis]MBS1007192.1 hypothetical protein [Levilactobacillus brevis]MBS1014314.1 hypothetical protein [Levilactobacillus brevis]QCZ44856.1 hypothetical protein UCCLBBS124_pB0011 [Levilactobacillus brevis]